ncbi:hypothetical protein [Blastopirellula marina]|uniref:Lipoprotein n=1 Tax=Blastopirellula marina DSM 3645 TaxID=314230 RepID=A3ZXE3_9BACT|nr:hypothetical protein [Blastopirellula marina]EAQ78733.1 hypothetical protein DSM3645_29566 [Blastopirellula marina DSM 3645]
MSKHTIRKNGPTIAAAAILLLVSTGCGSSGGIATAPVQGTVTWEGEPVTAGAITFRPSAAGKSASGKIQSDGTFELGTYHETDGAVIGPGVLSYTAPRAELPKNLRPGQSLPKGQYTGLTPQDASIEIHDGVNTLRIELTPRR